MKTLLLISLTIALCFANATADPTDLDGGCLIAHYPPGLGYTAEMPDDYCARYSDEFAITDHSQQNNTITDDGGATWYVIAAFLGDKTWCGTEFGFGGYNSDSFVIVDAGPCLDGNLELPSTGWPGPDEGTALVATHTQWSGNYQAIYWFGGYSYASSTGPTVIELDVGSSGNFVGFGNCDVPARSWTATAGGIGVGTEGVYVEPTEGLIDQACCDDDGTCILIDIEYCSGTVYPDLSCDPNPCPQPDGSCCYPDGHCEFLLSADCEGIWTAFDVCDPNPCEQPLGACCYEIQCMIRYEIDCYWWWMMFEPCDPNPCVRACCNNWDICVLTIESQCNGQWLIDVRTCDPNPCDDPVRACCDEMGNCTVTEEPACAGVWMIDERYCHPNPCPFPERACCTEMGECTITTETGCDGLWYINELLCDPNPCLLPERACCNDMTCTITYEADCAGDWLFEFDLCDPNPCDLSVRACCAEDGTCTLTEMDDCDGIWMAMEPVCNPNPCPQPIIRACCDDIFNCTLTEEDDCDGYWLQYDSSCDPNPCESDPTGTNESSWGGIKSLYR